MSTITASPVTTATAVPPCAMASSIFQNPLLEEAGAANTPEARRTQQLLQSKAEKLCGGCPLLASCFYEAVVRHDVAGYVAGTTPRQRSEIRSVLGIRVQPEDLDTLAGVTAPNRQVDHDEVVRLRNANPFESLESIAQRLGCSLSTVKRHLRRARGNQEAPAPLRRIAPSSEQVMHAYAEVVLRRRSTSASRAA